MLRSSIFRLISDDQGVLPARIAKDLLRRVNRTLGEPLADEKVIEARALAAARLADARMKKAPVAKTTLSAPVLVYFERDRNQRELERVRELLASLSYEVKELDVANDEATLDFVCRTARCERDHLPIVFVGPTPVGPYPELVKWNVSGALKRAVTGN